jgi:parvulin-like peptidyl-prolyl isomerase
MTRKTSSAKSPARASRNKKQLIVFAASGFAVLVLCVALKLAMGNKSAHAEVPNPFRKAQPAADNAQQQPKQGVQQAGATTPKSDKPQHDIMALVNGQEIHRDFLASACCERYGNEVLEGLVNKRLIQHYCKNRNITVTDAEVDAEVERLAKRFKIGKDQWLEMLEKERNIHPEQYKRDILWPTLALRKCAANDIVVSDQELQNAYDAQYGPAVKARLIVVNNRQQADQLHAQLVKQPNDFPRLAMQNSVDVNSASIGGMIQPIHHHVGDPNIEKAVFALQPNQISEVIPVGEQFAILKCEGPVPARNVPMETVKDELTDRIQESKLREVAGKLFKQLQDSSTVQNVWNNPQLRAQMPGVVATINGEQIPYSELAEECLMRFDREVLEVEISHALLNQALKKANLTVTDQDLNDEMAHAAVLAGVVGKDGKADMVKWIHAATEEQGITKDRYMKDSVWPSAALKKLTGGTIQISDDDLKKGFDANYGERVRCRAIVLASMRKAQEVWGKARQNTSVDYFSDLAEQYSVEPSSKALRGEVPPIRHYGGQPQLEDVAFDLKPGELSGIIQLGDKFVILKCEGRTQPVEVNPQEVQTILKQDIFEKKLRMAMSEKFDDIRSKARIDNFLTGTSVSPERVKPSPGENVPHIDQAVMPTSGTTQR